MEKIWTTKDGEKISYSKLEDSHLLNILFLLERRSKEGVETSWKEYVETGYDGDSYVPDFITVKGVLYGNDYLKHTDYKSLKNELKRRKIK